MRRLIRVFRGGVVALAALHAIVPQSSAQDVNASVTNSLRYGSGLESVGEGGFVSEQRKEYLDNMTDARLFVDNATFGIRLDLSEPPEYGVPFTGIRKRFVEFTHDEVEIRAGDIYDLFGRGLSLNLFENRQLGFDNGLDGVRVRYRNKLIRATVLGGTIRFAEPLSLALGPVYEEHQTLRAALVELRPISELRIGGSFVWAKTRFPTLIPDDEDTSVVKLPEFFATIRSGSFELFASYVTRLSAVNSIDSNTGSAAYVAITHRGTGYGITLEYKDFRYDVVDPLERNVQYRPTRMLGFQNPPIVHKEHSFTLLSRYPHIVDFTDEVGFQLDAFYSPAEDLTLNMNCAVSSRHYAYELDRSTFSMNRVQRGAPWLPAFSEERSPFWEVYADGEWYYMGEDQPDSYLRLGIDRRVEVAVEVFNPLSPLQPFRMTGIPVQVQHALDDEWSFKVTSEHQWVSKFMFPDNDRYYNHLLTVSVSRSPNLTLGARYELTTHEFEANGKKGWIVGEVGYRIGTRHLLSITYGSERGGQVCSNGICRVVYPFNGARLSIISHL